jgi:uncharacterized protein DUF222
VSEASFPGPGPDGEQPPPGDSARDEAASSPPIGARDAAPPRPEDEVPDIPRGVPADDWDGDAEMASYIADLDAGRARIPEEWEIEGPAATVGLGDAADVDLAELAAMLGPDGLGGDVFAQDRSADAMRPGPVLAALTEQATGGLDRLTDNQVIGAMTAAGRLAARAEYLRLTAVAEFTRRREAQLADATARRVPRGCRDGEFPDAELGMELITSQNAARDTMDLAGDLPTRLPRTWAALGAGLIDADRARLIWRPTRHLSDADAARADEILAALAPGLRYDQLARKAVAVAMKLDPEAFTRGKEQARQDRQRVQAGREESGNAFLSGRELAIEDALASKAHIDALAVALRRGGMPGTLQQLRVLAFNDLTQGRHPLDRLTGPRPADPASQASQGGQGGSGSPAAGQDSPGDLPQAHGVPRGDAGTGGDGRPGGRDSTDAGDGDDDASWDGCPDMTQWQHERRGTTEDDDDHHDDPGAPPGPPGLPAPFPALINLTIPAGTILGWSAAPGEAGGWGLTDPGDTRRLLQAASLHPRTRWCATLLGPDGTAVAHGCARGTHPWIPPPDGGGTRDGPDARQAAALTEFLRSLNVTFTPITNGTCDHAGQEDRYTPSRKLKHLVRTRTATCTAPGCGAQAVHCDLDHTLPYPAGITCQCDLAPACRRHHRCKQAPGWHLEQPEPGVMTWTTPAGRSHTTKPTIYET